MPPKKQAANSVDLPQPPSSDAAEKETAEKKTDAAPVRKPAAHPSTAIMMREALKALDSRKGVSSQAIQGYIKHNYPSVDIVRLKTSVRKALKKGVETGTLVRPANSSVTTGALGKFRLAPTVKESKSKSENEDPNMQKAPKVAKDGVKKPKKAGATKTKDENGDATTLEDTKPPKKSKKDEAASSKAAPAKKPKAKKAEVKQGGEGSSDSTKVTKPTKGVKTAKVAQSKAAKAGSDAPGSKTTGKRGKKTE